MGHDVTIATRGNAEDVFGGKVERIIVERTDADNMKKALNTKETDFDGFHRKMEWCTRFDYPYEEIKRLAESIQKLIAALAES